jgi:thiol-disulfide isomerase/thioredoxin
MSPIQLKSSDSFILQDLDVSTLGVQSKYYVLLVKQEWCGHCKRYWPSYESQSANLGTEGITCLYIEGTESPDILLQWKELVSPAFEIQGFPTLLAFDSVGKYVGELQSREDIAGSVAALQKN